MKKIQSAAQIGLRASFVDENSGFVLGDIILAVNDNPVTNRLQLINALEDLHKESVWRIKNLRDQQTIELEWRG